MPAQQARAAEQRQDWLQALHHWTAAREYDPADPQPWRGAAMALRMLGRHDAAAHLLEQGLSRFPDEAGLWLERAWLTQAGGDRDRAGQLWQEIRQRFPDLPEGHVGSATVLRVQGQADAAEQVLAAAAGRFPGVAAIAIEAARVAQARTDWSLAATRWAAVRAAWPGIGEAYLQEALALQQLARPHEAEQILAVGRLHAGGDCRLAVAQARLLLDLHRWEEALGIAAVIRRHWPELPDGHTIAAAALAGCNRIDAADALLRQGAAHLPEQPVIALALAQLPVADVLHDRKDWHEAASRLREVTRRFPRFLPARQALIGALHRSARLDEAEAAAARAMAAFPDDTALAARWATLAQERGDSGEAIRRFQAALARFPSALALVIGLADALSCHGRHAEAETVLATAPAADGLSARHALTWAMLATRRADWTEAAARWAAARRRFPQDSCITAGLFQARLAAAEVGTTLPDPPAEARPARAAGPDTASPQEVLARFESLGGTPYGCEFGLVQRAVGLEPLGLLRWSGCAPEHLAAALEARFEGIGEPEQTELIHPASDHEEYQLRDRRFGLRTHTFITPAEIEAGRMLARACLRQQFLRRRLLQQLDEGNRIFVYRHARRALTAEELQRLHRAIRAHGAGTLLVVRAGGGEQVEQLAPGLLAGTISRFAISAAGAHLGPATPHWLALCRKALRRLPGDAA
ncbi:Cellulose synthase operon protein C [Rhodovastum atsumiense]|uniref:Tetratricopeptide repeat protein n=1 Tax=Rhodovastum atsumiense TaxID=504468 RepID=A0A5M6ISN0_9PROT|nr:tetratricopeptide repeat protein [Rhodovastum atsumiense]KAA5610857.1 tetratricopeptide repeat protein [Rhodovastum atsumiense]CAH2602088.1 Cellulose synthase operon protein C [Rhodovastum atsumiense]